MKIVVQSAMHGRHDVVKYCLRELHKVAEVVAPEVELTFLYGCSSELDKAVLKSFPLVTSYQIKNQPLHQKFNKGIELLKDIDYDAVICIGSDDLFGPEFVYFVYEQLMVYEHIGFTDIWFKEDGKHYYWGGYESGRRKGEPAGAGKAYTKAAIEKLNYELFGGSDVGLDRNTYQRSKTLKRQFFSLKEWALYLCDVKSKGNLTPLSKFSNLVRGDEEKELDYLWP